MSKSIIAVNQEGKIIHAKDLTNTLRSNDYRCNHCMSKVKFVKESKRACAYFSHMPGQKQCSSLTFDTEDKKSFKENKMSDFHRLWQSIFPVNNVEVFCKKDKKKRYADIEISNIVFEIQHSPIKDNIVHERNEFYKSLGKQPHWILDITDINISVNTVIFSHETTHSLCASLSSWVNLVVITCLKDGVSVILDNYCSDLFIVVPETKLDTGNIRVDVIDRNKFLAKYGTTWPVMCKKVSNKVRDQATIVRMLRILNRLPFIECYSFHYNIGAFLQEAGFTMREWINWITDNRPYKNEKGFGQHKNHTLYSLDMETISWYLNILKNISHKKRQILLTVKQYHQSNLELQWKRKFDNANPYTLDFYLMLTK